MRIRGSAAVLVVLAIMATPALYAQTTAATRSCESLMMLSLPHATIVSAKSVPAGPIAMATIQGPVNLDVPARFEVHGVSRPSADSEI